MPNTVKSDVQVLKQSDCGWRGERDGGSLGWAEGIISWKKGKFKLNLQWV